MRLWVVLAMIFSLWNKDTGISGRCQAFLSPKLLVTKGSGHKWDHQGLVLDRPLAHESQQGCLCRRILGRKVKLETVGSRLAMARTNNEDGPVDSSKSYGQGNEDLWKGGAFAHGWAKRANASILERQDQEWNKHMSYFEETWGPLLHNMAKRAAAGQQFDAPFSLQSSSTSGLVDDGMSIGDPEDSGICGPAAHEKGLQYICSQDSIDFASRLADESGEILREHFGRPGSKSARTTRDAVRGAVVKLTNRYFPHASIAWEDGTVAWQQTGKMVSASHGKYTWMVQAIDGEQAFERGVPEFTTVIGLLRNGVPILGMIDQPMVKQRWLGATGRETLMNGKVVRCSRVRRLADATLYTTPEDNIRTYTERSCRQRACASARISTSTGSSYAFGLLCSGMGHVVLAIQRAPPITCVMVPLVEGAGGVMGDWEGRTLLGSRVPRRVLAAASSGLAHSMRCVLTGTHAPADIDHSQDYSVEY